MIYSNYLKRVLDVFFSLCALLLLSPVLVILIIALVLSNQGAGVFFLQPRPGLNGKVFRVIKFKTMTDKRADDGALLADIERITKIGSWIRSTSLDELPQLINVLKGDMALVGPRPLMVKYLPLYNDFQARRHNVRPGITGWAQVNGRNAISWDEKFKLDVYYADNLSFLLDCKILALTFVKVFARAGINSSNEVPMRPFLGNDED